MCPPGCIVDDFTFGEQWTFEDIPDGPFLNECRWHLWSNTDLSKMVNENFEDVEYTPEYLYEHLKKVHERGGVVTYDIKMDIHGNLDKEEKRLFSLLKNV